MTGPLLFAFIAAAAQQVAVETLEDGRLRLSATADASSPEMLARAQLNLMREAERRCRDRGRAVSEGALEANQVPGGGNRIRISETYRCVPSAER